MRRPFTIALASLALLAPASADASPVRCMEDQPCWSWSTMGNHKRGIYLSNPRAIRSLFERRRNRAVFTADKHRIVVGPCGYALLPGYIRQANPRLRGDWWALRHGCFPPL